MVVKVAISGAAGRMGRRLLSLAFNDKDVELVQAIEYAAHPLMGKVNLPHRVRPRAFPLLCFFDIGTHYFLLCFF
jgi:dihydrodipicolinate reductase